MACCGDRDEKNGSVAGKILGKDDPVAIVRIQGAFPSSGEDVFVHPMWDHVPTRLADKAVEIRRQGFFGNAMQPFETIHYGGLVNILRDLDERFEIRHPLD